MTEVHAIRFCMGMHQLIRLKYASFKLGRKNYIVYTCNRSVIEFEGKKHNPEIAMIW